MRVVSCRVIGRVRVVSCTTHTGFTSDKLMQKMRYDMTAEDYIDIDVHTCVYAGEDLFENDHDEGEASIAAAVLDALARSPIDARCPLAQNIRTLATTRLLCATSHHDPRLAHARVAL